VLWLNLLMRGSTFFFKLSLAENIHAASVCGSF
jgi:hypothetical protein